MSISRSKQLSDKLRHWDTTRYELLKARICDLNLQIDDSPVERFVERVKRELVEKGFIFKPKFYLTDIWGCPDEIPNIGIPFYLADKRLMKIEEEQTGGIEDDSMTMMLLRHEAGHAINYSYRLWLRQDWVDMFGPFSKPYRDAFRPDPSSREFVRHLAHGQYGRNYAQKHPDEDFAETFAVWLTPNSSWRRRYRFWPAFKKLLYVDRLMRKIRTEPPILLEGQLLNPVESINTVLADHYGQMAERYRAAAEGYVDDKLKEVFPPCRSHMPSPAHELLAHYHINLLQQMTRWTALNDGEAKTILEKLEDRCRVLDLQYPKSRRSIRLMELTALSISLAMDYAYTGKITG